MQKQVNKEDVAIIQARDGDLDQRDSSGMEEKWFSSGCILKIEPTGYISELGWGAVRS